MAPGRVLTGLPTQVERAATVQAKPRSSESPALDVIVVTSAGGGDHLRACLESLERHPLRSGPMTVQVIDNDSGDWTDEMVRERFPWARLHALDWNAGFCHSNNLGLREASAPLALLLNPDTEVTEGALDHMVSVMEEKPDIGMSGCRLVRRDGSFDHAAKRSFPTLAGALSQFAGVAGRGRAGSRLAQYRAPGLGERETGEVDAVNGAFMLVRRSALPAVGLLDEQYWLYMEDLDWCYRFKQQGWKVWYEGTVTVIHVKGGTSVERGHRGLRPNFAFHRGMGRFYRKFYAGRRPLLDAAVYLGIAAKLLVSVGRSTIGRRSLR